MIRREVEMGRKVERDWDVVQSMRRHGIFGLEDTVEVVRVPVVANEGVDRQP